MCRLNAGHGWKLTDGIEEAAVTCFTCAHATCETTEWLCRQTAPHTPCEARGWSCGGWTPKTRRRYGDTDTHDHACDECGQVFDCGAPWHREPDADGFMRPRRDCADQYTVCDDCRNRPKDAHDYACDAADAAHHDANC